MSARCRTTIALPRPTPRDACSRRLPCASARTRFSSAASPDGSRISRSISTASAPAADEVVATIRADLPVARHPLPRPLAPFLGRRARPLGRSHARWRPGWTPPGWPARPSTSPSSRVLLDAGAGPDWRYEEGRTGETFSRSEGLAVASFDMFVCGRLLEPPRRSLPGRRGCADRADAAGSCERLPGRGRRTRSWGSKAAPRSSTGSAAWSRTNPDTFGQRRRSRVPAASSTFSRPRRRTASFRHRASSKRPCSPISARSGRGASRSAASISATPGAIRSRRARRTPTRRGLVPFHKLSQWLVLFPDRAAAMGRDRGRRHRRAHRACPNTATAGCSSTPA